MERARYVRTVLAWHDHTQADLARILGITQPAANRKLRGLRRFLDDELLAIADAYGLNPAHLLRPPGLDEMLGCVPSAGVGLLTSTKYQVGLVSTRCRAHYGTPAKTGRIPSLSAA